MISETIIKTVNDWIEKGKVKTAYDINNGLCEEFADNIAKIIPDVHTLCIENLTIDGEGEEYDFDLEINKHIYPQDFQKKAYNAPGHVWVYDGFFHYDAECPHGQTDYLMLPIFRRKYNWNND